MPSILIAGALTIDEFSDGRRAPGGSVIHAGLAAVADGAEVTTLTVAGPEPEADAGRARLASLGILVAGDAPATTIVFEDSDSGVASARAAGLNVRRVGSPKELLPFILEALGQPVPSV